MSRARKIVRQHQLPIDHLLARIRMQDGVFPRAAVASTGKAVVNASGR